ncbi:LytR/AlgR family response regulator transcription factor [Kordia jejudonensis]|uniref:LytR/AlgR family response regulator transcription factor n=1 Tax=Kordia jejudonensis TaxID=1348245 RepID=UPI0006997301|nr:response regulator transcription factor [Kordia jejudonensis]
MKDCNILIVEDEQIIAENLRFILKEYKYDNVDVAIDADEAQELFSQKKYQLVLMDINLGEYSSMDGIDLIKILSQQQTFNYIYITANADAKTLEKAKTTTPTGYIVKPFTNKAVFANVEMALSSVSKSDSFTFINKGIKQQIQLSEITHIEAEGAYSYIYKSDSERYLVRKSLSEFMKIYQSFFIRIHKSTIINKEYIQGYTSQFVRLSDLKLPLGRSYKKDFLQHVKNLSF